MLHTQQTETPASATGLTPARPGLPFSITLGEDTLQFRLLGTNAEPAYDGFGTFSLSECYEPEWLLRGSTEMRGRIVAIRDEHLDWQITRYGSGLHQTWELSESYIDARTVLDIVLERLQGGVK